MLRIYEEWIFFFLAEFIPSLEKASSINLKFSRFWGSVLHSLATRLNCGLPLSFIDVYSFTYYHSVWLNLVKLYVYGVP